MSLIQFSQHWESYLFWCYIYLMKTSLFIHWLPLGKCIKCSSMDSWFKFYYTLLFYDFWWHFHEWSKTLYPFCWFMSYDLCAILLIHFISGIFGAWICCRASWFIQGVSPCLLIYFFIFLFFSTMFNITFGKSRIHNFTLISSLYFMMGWKNGVAARKEVMILACFWKFLGKISSVPFLQYVVLK